MKRTGCCGCPFDLHIADTLTTMRQYEPKLYKVCMNVFGLSYELMDKFNCRKRKCLPDEMQLTLQHDADAGDGQ